MRTNPVKEKLSGGEMSLGTFAMEFATTGLARLASTAGAEFVVLDMEHTGWSMETIRDLIATHGAASAVPLVRVPATEYHFIARALDVGAMGIMVPMVHTVAQAQEIVAASFYPPKGRRGAAFAIAHDDYEAGPVSVKIEQAHQRTLLIAQIESMQGVENAEAIAGVQGIDVLWIGHFDLTCALGIPAQFDHPQFEKSVRHVVRAAENAGKAAGILVATPEEARHYLELGFRIVAYGVDLWLYQKALQEGLEAIRTRSR